MRPGPGPGPAIPVLWSASRPHVLCDVRSASNILAYGMVQIYSLYSDICDVFRVLCLETSVLRPPASVLCGRMIICPSRS